ncbi:MAG TPA: hypothetical protein PLK77_14110 [Pyrinomonadaceae bacterium]|nr:hypothetical protein [Pyrinomonadaceae bacterium]
MKEKYIQILGIALVLIYGIFVVFLYAAEPRSLEEISSKAIETVQNAATKGQVITGTYEIDQAKFNEGLNAFRQNNFVLARDAFAKADPERRDAKTQYYIAYSFYRQGWGRLSNDDAMFKQGLESLERVDFIDKNFRSDDANLQLRTPAELKNEIEEGLRVTADDFNPLKVLRERK